MKHSTALPRYICNNAIGMGLMKRRQLLVISFDGYSLLTDNKHNVLECLGMNQYVKQFLRPHNIRLYYIT